MAGIRYRLLSCLIGASCITLGGLLPTPLATGAATPKCAGRSATVVGTARADVLNGTRRADVIVGRGNADTIRGRGGKDVICGGAGNNDIVGARGDDLLVGGADDDAISGGAGVDRFQGRAGNDRLSDESSGADKLAGGPDVDVCTRTEGDSVSCEFGTTDSVIFAPRGAPLSQPTVDVETASAIGAVDLYPILDRSGSMAQEITTIKNNLASVVSELTCEPAGTGDPENCILDLWAGAGTVGYSGSGAEAFQNFVDIQPNPSFASVPTTEPSPTSNTTEPLTFATYATITGQGGASFGMGGVPSRSTCSGSPAANAGYETFGYPCFRVGALPVVVLATDEPPLSTGDTLKNPSWASVVQPQFSARSARLVGLLGSSPTGATQTDLQQMATETGAVDAANGNAPLVFDGAGTNAATALGNGIRALAAGLPLEVRATAVDDPTDAVDAASAFVRRLEVLPLGTPACTAGLTTDDVDADGFDETYVDATPGTPLCWRLVARKNKTVSATSADQVFRAIVEVTVDGISVVDELEVFFVVPRN